MTTHGYEHQCRLCDRGLIDWRNPPRPDDPRINCGGDCLACMARIEGEMGAPDEICTKVQFVSGEPDGFETEHAA